MASLISIIWRQFQTTLVLGFLFSFILFLAVLINCTVQWSNIEKVSRWYEKFNHYSVISDKCYNLQSTLMCIYLSSQVGIIVVIFAD